jgi:hypothetical protein
MDIYVDEFDYLGKHIVFPTAPSPPPPTLLTLPLDIRKKIYHHVFVVELTGTFSGTRTFTMHFPHQFNEKIALLFVNRQIHHEAFTVFYNDYYPYLNFQPRLPREGIALFNSLCRHRPQATAQIITVPDLAATGLGIESLYLPIGLLHPNIGAYFPIDMLQLGLKSCTFRGCGAEPNLIKLLEDSEKDGKQWYLCGFGWKLKATLTTTWEGPTEYLQLDGRMGAFYELSRNYSSSWTFLEEDDVRN